MPTRVRWVTRPDRSLGRAASANRRHGFLSRTGFGSTGRVRTPVPARDWPPASVAPPTCGRTTANQARPARERQIRRAAAGRSSSEPESSLTHDASRERTLRPQIGSLRARAQASFPNAGPGENQSHHSARIRRTARCVEYSPSVAADSIPSIQSVVSAFQR